MIQIFMTALSVAMWAGVIAFLVFVARHEIEKAIFFLLRKIGGEK